MKKWIGLVLILWCSNANAWILNHELRPQYRVWKTSSIGTGDFSGTQISTSPIIFHAIIGSGTVNFGGTSAFTLFQSTGMTSMSSNASTKAIIPLDNTTNNGGLGYSLDILVTTHSYFNKSGASSIQYLWDYVDGGVKFNRFPID